MKVIHVRARLLGVAFCLAVLSPLIPTSAAASKFAPASPELHERSAPTVGEVSTAEIGAAVLFTERFISKPAVRIEAPYESPVINGNRVVLQPVILPLEGSDHRGQFFSSSDYEEVWVKSFGLRDVARFGAGVVLPPAGGAPQVWWGSLFGRSVGAAPGLRLTPVAAKDRDISGFRRELTYAGTSGGVIRLTYREFIDDLARPAFTQDLSFDLSPGVEIGYKGARIRVIKADGTAIEYELLKQLSAH